MLWFFGVSLLTSGRGRVCTRAKVRMAEQGD